MVTTKDTIPKTLMETKVTIIAVHKGMGTREVMVKTGTIMASTVSSMVGVISRYVYLIKNIFL